MLEELVSALVACDSTNPELVPGGAGEGAVAAMIAARLSAAGLLVERTEVEPGRPNVVATLSGTGGGRRLLLCGHTDVVAGSPEQFRPEIRDGRMYGRGCYDMKGGLAAAIAVVERIAASGDRLAGDLVLAAVCDEEWRSIGAEELARRNRADAAILPEPSELDLITEHGGFSWHTITSHGIQAAGSDTAKGRDGIAPLGTVLTGIAALDRQLDGQPHASYGRGSVHASTISGGESLPVYPASCSLGVERCLIPGETWKGAVDELEGLLQAAREQDPEAQLELETIVGRDPVRLSSDELVISVLEDAFLAEVGRPVVARGDIGWCDSGLLVEAGIPCVVFGPAGAGEHTDEEWVDLASVETCARVIERAARAFCA